MERERNFNEEMLSDTGYASEYEIDCIEKFVSEICALNARTKHCVIHNYYTMGGALTICTACMIRIADINNVGMSTSENMRPVLSVSGRSCTNCKEPLHSIFSCSMCPH